MKIIYKCESCGKEFDNINVCKYHEMLHLNSVDKFKYYIQNVECQDLCKYCAHIYYVYGCEANCSHKDCTARNNYKDFIPHSSVSTSIIPAKNNKGE